MASSSESSSPVPFLLACLTCLDPDGEYENNQTIQYWHRQIGELEIREEFTAAPQSWETLYGRVAQVLKRVKPKSSRLEISLYRYIGTDEELFNNILNFGSLPERFPGDCDFKSDPEATIAIAYGLLCSHNNYIPSADAPIRSGLAAMFLVHCALESRSRPQVVLPPLCPPRPQQSAARFLPATLAPSHQQILPPLPPQRPQQLITPLYRPGPQQCIPGVSNGFSCPANQSNSMPSSKEEDWEVVKEWK
ncbi:hypothetical protein S40285_10624 [Stachybotrys chlorohalonatus IBT 40285]|uniref:Uncharacterized protein n=1 Tax=Stachybotrys chlorohalonatus (strain IBT 40285) TaxID=1283841 RepID=A0A084QS73_STAC4|nr:hypothetical protein S40285_10624 [Stachybotrys chlorohalonata IBT 40285]